MEIKTILVPTDFSDCAISATNVAIDIAKKSGAQINLLHSTNSLFDWMKADHMNFHSGVLPEDLPSGIVENVNDGLQEATELLDKSVEQVKKQGVDVQGHLKINLTHDGITEFCRENNVDLIVMGSKGTSGFVSELIGSNAQRIARTATCPVVFVKDEMKNLSINKILYPSTFEEESEMENLHYAKAFAAIFGARLDLLFVNTPHYFEETKPCLERLEEVKEKFGLSESKVDVYDHFTPEDGILAYVEQHGYDMVIMSKFQFTGWKRLSKPFVTEPVINHANVPVLSMFVKEDQT